MWKAAEPQIFEGNFLFEGKFAKLKLKKCKGHTILKKN
jgi:hypothetical protein